MKLVVGLSGKMGSGKTVVSRYLHKKYGAEQMRFSQILMDILERLHIPSEREALQKLGHALRSLVGEDVIVNAFRADLEAEKSRIIVVDGVRYPNEVDMLRSFGNNVLLYIDAPAEVRYRRCVERNEKGEGRVSFEKFLEAENRETERYLNEIAELSDYVVDNTGSVEELQQKVDKIFREKIHR
ncbi:MAG: AAA family ATPase [Candidatus Altiarchaeota archaeon]|nr:AAA family ATPase [Candidatus Altiarchaeota archaeon]